MEALPTLEEIDPEAALDRVGGKALSLARLARAGFTVPPAFVITTAVTQSLQSSPEDRSLGAWPAILQRYHELGFAAHPVAVRSSAVDEDSATASFAGQHATVLNVTGADELEDAVRTCIASLHSESAVAYREHAGGRQTEARMAVIVQRMVPAVVGGVAFSIDPLTGDTSRAVVEAVAGSGDSLVSGAREGDRIVLSRPALEVVDEHHPGMPVLHTNLAIVIAQAAIQAEEAFGAPQDIEFAFDGDTLWMLQARPVTVAGDASPSGGWTSEFDTPTTDDDLWTSSNVQEVLPGLLTPLTMSIFGAHAHIAYTRGYQRLRLLSKDEWPNFVGLFYNRAFLNVGATRLIAERAFGASGDAAEHRYLGGELPKKPRRDNSLKNWKHRFLSVIPLTRMTIGIFRAADRLDRETTAWEQRLRSIDPATLSNSKLESLRQELMHWSSNNFSVHLQASACAGAGFEMVAKAVQPILGDETEARVPALFTGMGGVESAQIGLDLWSLSRIALQQGMDDAV
ncbi:MAG TPA: PEP/pyruvate-binding domain-containing protein, partial [Tepidiformaceae bacterium]